LLTSHLTNQSQQHRLKKNCSEGYINTVAEPLKTGAYRWMAEISYRDDTPTDVVGFEELRDLHDHVEMGPDWNLIDQIVVTLNLPTLSDQRQP